VQGKQYPEIKAQLDKIVADSNIPQDQVLPASNTLGVKGPRIDASRSQWATMSYLPSQTFIVVQGCPNKK
jgi:hypothetical protein